MLVNINPAYRLHELDYALNKVGCRALVTATAFKSSDYAGMLIELAARAERCPPGALEGGPACRRCASSSRSVRHSMPGSFAFADVAWRAAAPPSGRG